MTLTQVWGALVVFIVCPVLGGLPFIEGIFYLMAGRRLSRLGTGNVSVSAAFYHGGTATGVLAVLSEAGKGIAAVLLARQFFPLHPEWELIALIALVMGRYWMGKGAGTTNVTWGIVAHDWIVAGLVLLIGGVGFTILRERQWGRIGVLVLLPLMLGLLYPQQTARITAAIALSVVLGWIYTQMPDDLDLPARGGQVKTRNVFRFFRGDKAIVSLDRSLDSQQVGQKAATLSQLKRWGYPVPPGWVLPPGDDPQPLIDYLDPSPDAPLAVRSSAIGEDTETASAAGQYQTILDVTDRQALKTAISQCFASYDRPSAVRYRQDRGTSEGAMAVSVQQQVRGVFSGVAFSRDPMTRHGDAVAVEALPGEASRVVSGHATPEQYRIWIPEALVEERGDDWRLPAEVELDLEGEPGDVPQPLLRQVAFLARHIETRYHGIPQDIEWTYDGDRLWLLQSRPITTLLPIWTRKIAAEVIPGTIRPLTWSINRPLTCGVWGKIFTLVLGDRAQGLDFNETATLHYARAYFNASLLGQIFRRMGLPAESLEFLTRGSSFSKPPLSSTIRNVPGLMRLLGREWRLEGNFYADDRRYFSPVLARLEERPACRIHQQAIEPLQSPSQLLDRADEILDVLERATYYSILAPLSLSLRQAILRVDDTQLAGSGTPEVEALQALRDLAIAARHLLPDLDPLTPVASESDTPQLFATLAEMTEGEAILEQFEQFVDRYGYLSDVATDIAVPTWAEDRRHVRELFAQFLFNPPPAKERPQVTGWKAKTVQRRLDLRGRVTAVYSQLLAQLRWTFVALEQIWWQEGILSQPGDLFFLDFAEIRESIAEQKQELIELIPQIVAGRRSQFERDCQIESVPALVYGQTPPQIPLLSSDRPAGRQLQGIGVSTGEAEGTIRILQRLQALSGLDRNTILVVPYTDSGWAPLLAQAGGVIAEVGGRLSHGAIVAREYGIPAVMNVEAATRRLQDGQRVRIDGGRGLVEILD